MRVFDRIAQRLVGGQIGNNGHFALALETINLVRPPRFMEMDEVRELHQPAVGAVAQSQRDVLQRFLRGPVARVGAQPHVVQIIVLAEGADDFAAHQRAQGVRDVLDLQPELARLFAVNLDA